MRNPTLPMVAVSRCCFIVVDCGCLFCGDDDIVGDNRGVLRCCCVELNYRHFIIWVCVSVRTCERTRARVCVCVCVERVKYSVHSIIFEVSHRTFTFMCATMCQCFV